MTRHSFPDIGLIAKVDPSAFISNNPEGQRVIAGENSRLTYDTEAIDSLALNIKANGQIQPGEFYVDKGGKPFVTGGFTRLLACHKLGIPWEGRRIAEPNHLTRLVRNLSENVARSELHAVELCIALGGVSDLSGKSTNEALGSQIGLSGSSVSNYLRVYVACRTKGQESGPGALAFSWRAAYQEHGASKTPGLKSVLELMGEHKGTAERLEAFAKLVKKAIEAESKPKTRAPNGQSSESAGPWSAGKKAIFGSLEAVRILLREHGLGKKSEIKNASTKDEAYALGYQDALAFVTREIQPIYTVAEAEEPEAAE